MRGVVLALAAATLGVEAWTVMTSAIDRPLTTASPRRKRHRAAKALPIELESRWAAKALPIELESPIEEAAVGEEASKARRPPAKALRSRRRRQRAAPAPPSTVQNVTDEWLGQAGTKLTRTPRGLRRVRMGYVHQPPALGTYRTHRAACPQGLTCCTG